MNMEYQIIADFEPGTEPEKWLIRISANGFVCGKVCLGTVEKDAFKTKLDELGWTEVL